jgi:hypothetical protein
VRFDRTNVIFKRKKPIDVLENEATFIGQYQQYGTNIKTEDLLGLILNFTKKCSGKIRYCQSDVTLCERRMVHCRDSRRNVDAKCYNTNEACGGTW